MDLDAMDQTFLDGVQHGLVWLPEEGMGYLAPGAGVEYGREYFAKYEQYAHTQLSDRLMAARTDLVRRHWSGDVVDVGVGSGCFCVHFGCKGFDVNPVAASWLKDMGRWHDPYTHPVDALTLWDVLEHVPEPAALVAQAKRWVFLSLPIFQSGEQALTSKHYRPGEHLWYWTDTGLTRWMERQGFAIVEHSTPETAAGREDIHSYAFRRRAE